MEDVTFSPISEYSRRVIALTEQFKLQATRLYMNFSIICFSGWDWLYVFVKKKWWVQNTAIKSNIIVYKVVQVSQT